MVYLEIAMFTFRPGLDIGNPSSETYKKLLALTAKTKSAPGIKFVSGGSVEEKPDIGVVARIWDSAADAQAFSNSAIRGELLTQIGPLLAALPITGQFEVDEDPQAVFEAPVTEIFNRYFAAADVPPIEADVLEKTKEFSKVLHTVGASATFTAWSKPAEKDGVSTQLEVLLVGWKSVEEHTEAKNEKAFTDSVGLIREHTPMKQTMVHVKFIKV